MFSINDENKPCLKLIDFGLSRSFFQINSAGEKALLRMETKAGTAFFMAPEVIKGNYSSSCDMWSAGCILYVMLCGFPPFDGETQDEIFDSILEGELDFSEPEWDSVSDEAKDLISNLLTNENDRFTPRQVLKHSWLKQSLTKPKKKIPLNHLEKLKDFSRISKVRKIILTFLASRVTNEDVEKQLQSFDKLDRNKDGYITMKELQKGLGPNYSQEDTKKIMESVDTDK